MSRDIVLKEIRPGAGFETGDFVEEKLGGATAERLLAVDVSGRNTIPRDQATPGVHSTPQNLACQFGGVFAT